jgi:GNAT superfamily N-acetyltransferase
MVYSPLSQVEALDESHDLSQFDCGRHPSLNEWLRRFAVNNQRSDASRTFVVHRNKVVVGYYSVASGSVQKEDAVLRVGKGLHNQPIPVVLLGRLAIDRREQGSGLGKALLKDALLRIDRASDIVAVRAVLVHAIDEEAAQFHRKFGFEESPTHPLHMLLLMKDLRRSLTTGTLPKR